MALTSTQRMILTGLGVGVAIGVLVGGIGAWLGLSPGIRGGLTGALVVLALGYMSRQMRKSSGKGP